MRSYYNDKSAVEKLPFEGDEREGAVAGGGGNLHSSM